MDREDLDLIIRNLPKESVKRACYIVREYKRYEKDGNFIDCAVTKEEYEEALKIILAYAYTTSDNNTVVELMKCYSDCNRNNGTCGFCDGEFQITKDQSKKLCKYYSDPFNI